MTDIAIKEDIALSVMYFFMESFELFIILNVWKITDKPPNPIIPVIHTSFKEVCISSFDRCRIPVVVSAKHIKIRRIGCGIKDKLFINEISIENIKI